MKHFITGSEFTQKELQKVIDTAISYKKGEQLDDHAGKILTLIFANPSLRTRLSFESGMKKMGGEVNVLSGNDTWQFEYEDGVTMDQDKQEHIKEAGPVISSYSDIIGMRKSELITTKSEHGAANWDELKKDTAINQLAKHATVPVMNMESNMFHPCQSMADMMSIQEKHGAAKKKYVLTWAPHPKALPLATPHSQLLTPSIFGMDVTLAHPEGFELDPEVIQMAQEKAEEAGGSFTITHNQQEAFQDAEIIVAKSWASLKHFGDWEAEKTHRAQFTDWIVNEEKMALTNDATFMHCLPVRRNVVVTDAVLDDSAVIQEAENRMWVQMAIINHLLTN